jgi:murein DD-endopeptidase MepM/ murein hydrolase activator NlpD
MRLSRLLSFVSAAVIAAALVLVEGGCATPGDKSAAPIYLIKVEKGDTLAAIAGKYDTTWQSIAKLNKLDQASRLEIGSILRVRPGPGGLVAGAGASPRLARNLPGKTKAKVYDDAELPNRPASEPQDGGFEEEDLGGHGDAGDEAPKKRAGLLFNNDGAAAGRFQWPVKGEISSRFGMRGRRMHKGLDIRAPYGASIYASAPGRVFFEGRKNGYGRTVVIQHGGKQTLYAHLSAIYVDEGDEVDQATLIGKVGTSGNANGPHLHFEVRTVAGQAVDPLGYLSGERYLSSRSDGKTNVN